MYSEIHNIITLNKFSSNINFKLDTEYRISVNSVFYWPVLRVIFTEFFISIATLYNQEHNVKYCLVYRLIQIHLL